MALLEFWRSKPEQVSALTIQQVVAVAGDGNIRDGSECSSELRAFLREISSDQIASFVRSCLDEAFKDSGMVLQDLVNEMGRRLGFLVEDGLYRGKVGAIGFDGIWRSKYVDDIILEVKTTDYVNISLDKIVNYRNRLISEGRVSVGSSILVVVGREDTGAIEAQIRGSRFAWDIRLIGADRLGNLLEIRERSEDDRTERQIQELLKPFEYTKVDKIIDVVFIAAQDTAAIEIDSSILNNSEEKIQEVGPQISRARHTQDRTDSAILNQIRLRAVDGLARAQQTKFHRHRQTQFWSADQSVRVCAAVSKRYQNSYKPYWYAYHDHWDLFLRGGQRGYFVLACVDRETAFAIPHSFVEQHVQNCSSTTRADRTYHHITLFIEKKKIYWEFTKIKERISLEEYEFRLA